MSAKTEAKNNLTLIGREITQWEEEITKKEEVIAKKERDIAEKQKDLDFRAEKKAQEYISKVLPAMLQEQRTLLSGRPWPPVEEGGVPRASEPEARVVRASRPRRGPR
ncbi:hypothetical protein AOL_s00173g24 [Orbilia oligospora ATCC 24927]|uniref:Uncharacterized protein n=2 Tax=Orbilia oligospora TaxID=2813651 RepID=G1XNK6_ARTOA|nr:hypothetical protein AOL_s00173g24 [Orbilia oligospora ATCC 24927]EGX44923.1 hypothetical protein AOL_s00173g24 [Orbilia oligospora ATCC 24927]KAF3286614.1 hypothetical protein TWF970_008466 [Orbilia oligospora]